MGHLNYLGFLLILYSFGVITSLDIEFVYKPIDVNIDSAPYIVSLRDNNKHICTGVVVTPTYILTAARCICYHDKSEFQYITVVYGVSTTKESGSNTGIKDVICHPTVKEYKNVEVGFVNIAVIETKQSIPDERVSPCISTLLPIDESCHFVGWNKTAPNLKAPPQQLQTLQLNLIDNSVCVSLLGNNFTQLIEGGFVSCASRSREVFLPPSLSVTHVDTVGYRWTSWGSPFVCNNTLIGMFDIELYQKEQKYFLYTVTKLLSVLDFLKGKTNKDMRCLKYV